MRRFRFFLLFALCFLIYQNNSLCAQGIRQEIPLVITNVSTINPAAGSAEEALVTDQTILISGNRIAGIGAAASTSIPRRATRIDGRGKYLIPGFWDMHVHFNRDDDNQLNVMAPLMIANGITSVRDMLGDCWEPCRPGRKTLDNMRELQRQVNQREVMSPWLQALSSALVNGPRDRNGYPTTFPEYWQPKTEDEGRELARFLQDLGVDFVKIYNSLPRAAFFGLVDEAKKVGLEVTGHLPWSVHPIEASDAGMRSIEHARWPAMACHEFYEEFRSMYARFAAGEEEFNDDMLRQFVQSAVPGFDKKRAQEIFQAFVKNDTYLDPTHLTREMDARAVESDYRNDP